MTQNENLNSSQAEQKRGNANTMPQGRGLTKGINHVV